MADGGKRVRKECIVEGCNNRRRELFNGMCRQCYDKTKTKMPIINPEILRKKLNKGAGKGGSKYTLNEALNKIYIVKKQNKNSASPAGRLSIPSVLIGKKVKLVLVENE